MSACTLVSPSPAWPDRHAMQVRWLTGFGLLLAGGVSAAQLMGYTATGFSVVCLLVAPAWLVTRPSRTELGFLLLAAAGTLGYLVSFARAGLPMFDQRILQWPSFALYAIGLSVLAAGRPGRLFALAAGIALGSCGYFATAGIDALAAPDLAAYWKYAFAPWCTLLAVAGLVLFGVSRRMQAGLIGLIALTSLALNYRSHALICVTVAAVLLAGTAAPGTAGWRRGALVAGTVAGFALAVPALARTGIGGSALAEKVALQETQGVPALLAGRSEPPLSLSAIAERPWLGWGSANRITPDVFARAHELALRLGFDPDLDLDYQWHLPNGDTSLHSTLLAAWAEGGIAAALLPAALLAAAIAIVLRHDRFGRWAAPAVLVAVQASWDLLFSPTTYNLLPMFAVVAVAYPMTRREAGA